VERAVYFALAEELGVATPLSRLTNGGRGQAA
jgi:hypothetical protein